MVTIVCRKQTVPLAVALDTPLNLLGKCEKELDTEKLVSLDTKNARNLVWASELVEEGLTTLDDLFLLPTALYAAAKTKEASSQEDNTESWFAICSIGKFPESCLLPGNPSADGSSERSSGVQRKKPT